MADEATTTETTPSARPNGVASGGGAASRESRAAAVRAATLAELEQMPAAGGEGDDAPAPSSPKATKPAAKKPAKPEPTDVEAGDSPPDDAADDTPDGDPVRDESPDDDGEKKPAATKDPELDKRLSVLQKAEKASKERLAKERDAAIEEVRRKRAEVETEWAPRMKAYEAYEATKKRAIYDPVAHFEALGASDDDFERAARAMYARSPAGAKDPRYKADAQRSAVDRERADEIAATRKELAELRQQLTARETAAAADREEAQYVAKLEKAVTPEAAPLLQRHMAKNADGARARLKAVAHELYRTTGDVPDAEDVIAAYEKQRRAELEESGVDVASLLKTTPKKRTPEADEKRPAATLGNDLSTTTVPRSASPKKSPKELREDTIRELEALERRERGDDAD